MRQPTARRPGRLFVMGLVAVGGLVTALGVWLREKVGKVPLELARSVARLEESGDFARFRVELSELLRANPPFREVFRDVLPLPPASFPEPPPASRRVALLAPLGVVSPPANAPLPVRWFDPRTTQLEAAHGLRVRLCPALRCADEETAEPKSLRADTGPHRADESRESAPLPLANIRTLADGSFAAELEYPRAAAEGWLRLRLVAADSTERDATEDQGWFRTTEVEVRGEPDVRGKPENASKPEDPGRPSLAASRYALLRICGQGRMTPSQADLLLAMLLEERGFDLAEAQLLELLRAEKRSSPASDLLLRSAYGRLRRHAGLPREPARRDDAANWAGTRNP